jgi:tetratricopeptide (TPR) repeat protein
MTTTQSTYERVHQLMKQGGTREAFALVPQMLAERPNDPSALVAAGRLASEMADFARSADYLRRAVEIDPTRADHWGMMGKALLLAAMADEGLTAYDKALGLDPTNPSYVGGKAEILNRQGRNDEALALLEPIMKGGNVPADVTLIYATICHNLKRREDAVAAIKRQLPSASTGAHVRGRLQFLLGRLLEELGRYDESFAAYVEANRHRAATMPFEPAKYVRLQQLMIECFSPANLASMPRSTCMSDAPVVIGALPRSGTTLTEQFIQAHPDAYGAGETPAMDKQFMQLIRENPTLRFPYFLPQVPVDRLDQIAQTYLAETTAKKPDAKRVVDKYLRNSILIGLFWQVFPKCRVIWSRRDPMDTCFSCFTNPLPPIIHPYTSDLRHLGLVYRWHEKLMRHWRDTLDLPFLDLPYEEVVASPEPWIRRIIEFCGLPWDDRCLRAHEAERTVMTISYDQVRRPVFDTSIGRWKPYEKFLGPLRESLEANKDVS